MIYRKRPRLEHFTYIGPFGYSITIRTHENAEHFLDKQTVEEVRQILVDAATTHGFSLFAYCFMPDHLHLLPIGGEASSLKPFMQLFKQKSGYYFKQKFHQGLWQPSYYDHVLRQDEDLAAAGNYILNNPSRKGLPSFRSDEPFCGSFLFEPER